MAIGDGWGDGWADGAWADGAWFGGSPTPDVVVAAAVVSDATAICRFQPLDQNDYTDSFLLLEDGSYFLLEDGGRLLLEPASITVRPFDTISCRFFSGKA